MKCEGDPIIGGHYDTVLSQTICLVMLHINTDASTQIKTMQYCITYLGHRSNSSEFPNLKLPFQPWHPPVFGSSITPFPRTGASASSFHLLSASSNGTEAIKSSIAQTGDAGGASAQLHLHMRAPSFQVPGPHSIEMLVQTTSSVLFSGVCISLSGWHPYCPLVTGWECLIYVSHPLPFPDL